MKAVHVVVTPTGSHPAPASLVAAFRLAPKRKDGSPDKRTIAGREAVRLEAEIVARLT